MSRCARCRVSKANHAWAVSPNRCPRFTPRDPLWIRALVWLTKRCR